MSVVDLDSERRGCLLIVSGPSGAGKTSICTPALAEFEGIALSVSHTTRAPRGDERDGEAYHFTADEEFSRMVADGEFAEWAEVHGFRYGTARREIEHAVGAGRDLVLDIDVQGARNLRDSYPDAVSVFMLPPSLEALRARLEGRGTDSREAIEERLRNACREIASAPEYDYIIVNDELERAQGHFVAIVRAERRRVSRVNEHSLALAVSSFDTRK